MPISALLGPLGVGRIITFPGPPIISRRLLLQMTLSGTLRGMVLTGPVLGTLKMTALFVPSPRSPVISSLPYNIRLLVISVRRVDWERLALLLSRKWLTCRFVALRLIINLCRLTVYRLPGDRLPLVRSLLRKTISI